MLQLFWKTIVNTVTSHTADEVLENEFGRFSVTKYVVLEADSKLLTTLDEKVSNGL